MKKRAVAGAYDWPSTLWVRAMACVGLLLAAACGGTGAAGTATGGSGGSASVATQVLAATDANNTNAGDANHGSDPNTLGMEHVLPLLHLLPPEAAMGMHCDPNAAPEHVSVCGQHVPGPARATWSACRENHGPFGHAMGPDANGMVADANVMAADPNGPHHRARLSSGTLTVTAQTTPDANTTCDANTNIVTTRQAQFSVTVSDANGPTMTVVGKNSESLTALPGAGPDGNITLDVNRTLADTGGNVLAQTVVTGIVRMSPDPNAPTPMHHADPNAMPPGGPHHGMPARILNGIITVNGDSVVLTNLAHHSACMWPSSGKVERTDTDGNTHTLVFGTPCGSATLDGKAVSLPIHGPHHPHGPPRAH